MHCYTTVDRVLVLPRIPVRGLLSNKIGEPMAQTKKGRKCGRDAAKCKSYRARHVREKNRMRDLRRHVNAFANDMAAASRLKSWNAKGVPVRKPINELPVMVK